MHARSLSIVSLVAALLLIPAIPMEAVGQVSYVPGLDEMTDEDNSAVVAIADAGDWKATTLGWKCLGDGLNVVLLTKHLTGRNNRISVTYRFDTDEAVGPVMWEQGAGSNKIAFAPMHVVPGFVARAKTANRVVIRVRDPADNETVTNTFYLAGAGRALNQLPCR